MAAGRPVIAYAAGGALETVVPDVTGVLFAQQSVAAIIQAVEGFDTDKIDPQRIRHHAEQFDSSHFKAQIQAFVAEKMETLETL